MTDPRPEPSRVDPHQPGAAAADALPMLSDHPPLRGYFAAASPVLFAVAAIAAALFMLSMTRDFEREARKELAWPTVRGEVLRHEIRDNPNPAGDWNAFIPVVHYRYRVDGRDYEAEGPNYRGADRTDRADAERLLARYPVGQRVTVHYDPDKPARATLRPADPPNFFLWFAGLIGSVALASLAVAVRRVLQVRQFYRWLAGLPTPRTLRLDNHRIRCDPDMLTVVYAPLDMTAPWIGAFAAAAVTMIPILFLVFAGVPTLLGVGAIVVFAAAGALLAGRISRLFGRRLQAEGGAVDRPRLFLSKARIIGFGEPQVVPSDRIVAVFVEAERRRRSRSSDFGPSSSGVTWFVPRLTFVHANGHRQSILGPGRSSGAAVACSAALTARYLRLPLWIDTRLDGDVCANFRRVLEHTEWLTNARVATVSDVAAAAAAPAA